VPGVRADTPLHHTAAPRLKSPFQIRVPGSHQNWTDLGHTQRLPEFITGRVHSAAAKSSFRGLVRPPLSAHHLTNWKRLTTFCLEGNPLGRIGEQTEADSRLRCTFTENWSEISKNVRWSDSATARRAMQPNAARCRRARSF